MEQMVLFFLNEQACVFLFKLTPRMNNGAIPSMMKMTITFVARRTFMTRARYSSGRNGNLRFEPLQASESSLSRVQSIHRRMRNRYNGQVDHPVHDIVARIDPEREILVWRG